MNRMSRAAVMLFLGLSMTRLLWTGSFGWFIQQRMKWPLLLATIALVLLAVYEGFNASREEVDDPDSATRSVAPKVGWLMVLPLLVLISVAPTGLGAVAADRVDSFEPLDVSIDFEPLEESSEPIELRVFDFIDRAIWDEDGSTIGRTVRLEGLVVNDPAYPDGFLLTRFMVSCCAADGVPLQVALRDVGQTFENDTWVIADVVLRELDVPYNELPIGERQVEADVINIAVGSYLPTDAYESP